MLPSIAALFTMVWTAIRIYETDTVRRLLGRKPNASDLDSNRPATLKVALAPKVGAVRVFAVMRRPAVRAVSGDARLVVVAEAVSVGGKGEIIGGIAGLTSPLWFSPQVLFAVEIAWWVREDHRGGTAGIKLLRAFEGWAKSIGCKAVCLSDLIINNTSPAGALFGKLGYSVLERSHIKGI